MTGFRDRPARDNPDIPAFDQTHIPVPLLFSQMMKTIAESTIKKELFFMKSLFFQLELPNGLMSIVIEIIFLPLHCEGHLKLQRG